MLKTRILLVAISLLVVWLLFQLPKVVVKNDSESPDSLSVGSGRKPVHQQVSPTLRDEIADLVGRYRTAAEKEKSAIFADSLANLYEKAGIFDSAAWFAGEATAFFNNPEGWVKAGDLYYKAYTYAVDQARQEELAGQAQSYYGKVMEVEPENLGVKTKMAMTYLSSENPMQGIMMLREVLDKDPENPEALFNIGMLAIQSGQYDRAIERFETLIRVDSTHIQGQLLLGVALLNAGKKARAKAQFEKVKSMDPDPAVQAEVDSYLKDLK